MLKDVWLNKSASFACKRFNLFNSLMFNSFCVSSLIQLFCSFSNILHTHFCLLLKQGLMSKVCIPPKVSSLSAGFESFFFFFFFWKDPLFFVLLNASLIVKVTELNEKTKITAQQLKCPLIFGYKPSPWWKIDRAVFKWLSKNQNRSNYSDQSQMGQTAGWTNHNS